MTFVNSSKILPFSFFDALRYLHRTASVYSRMLRCIMLPPSSNTFYEATIPFSVTIIMRQFALSVNIKYESIQRLS